MKNENYINIQGWMVNELKLKGNKLSLYALIYGFSQDGENEYKASFKYISKALSCSKRHAQRLIDQLVKDNLIIKTQGDSESSNSYRCNKDLWTKCLYPMDKMSIPPMDIMSLPYNNIYINNTNHTSELDSSSEGVDISSLVEKKNINKCSAPENFSPHANHSRHAPDAHISTESDLNIKNDITLGSNIKTQYRTNTEQKLEVDLEFIEDLLVYAEQSGVKLSISRVALEDLLINYDRAEIIKYGKIAIDWIVENPKKAKGSILRSTRLRKFLESAKKKSSNPYW